MRSLWNGSIVIGQVVVPIKLHSAIEDRRIRFRQVHEEDLSVVEYRRFCTKEEVEVPWEEVRKGLELDDGSLVLFDEGELSVIAGSERKAIEIEGFVQREVVGDEVIDRPYYLGARGADGGPYRALRDALESEGLAGVGEFAFHGRRRGVLLVAEDSGPMRLYTLRPADSVVAPSDLERVSQPHRQLLESEIEAARALVDGMSGEFESDRFEDRHRDELLDLIEQKAEGTLGKVSSKPPRPATEDLTEALRSSLGSIGAEESEVPA